MIDLRYALRMLLKSPASSVVAFLALALGIGGATAMFAVVYAFLLRPLPFADPEELVMLQSRSTKFASDVGVNYLDFRDWREQAQSFSDLAFFNLRWNGNLRAPDGSTQTLKTTLTTTNLFSLLGVAPAFGRSLTPADDEQAAAPVILLSDRVWRNAFGRDPAILGREVQLDGTMRTVIGVMPSGFRFPSQTDLWIPAAAFFGSNAGDRTWRADQVIARLRRGVSIESAATEMTVIARRLADQYPESNEQIGAAVVPLREHWTGPVSSSLVCLLAACAGLLVIACANVGQLLLARTTARRAELVIRAALGATRLRIAGQLLTEAALLALLGNALGLIMAFALTKVIAASIPVELPFWIRVDVNPLVLAFGAVVSCLSAMLAGSLPARTASRIDLITSLKQSGAGSRKSTAASGRMHDLLTAGQVAMSAVLLIGAILVLRSAINLNGTSPGFDAHGVLMFEVNPTYRGDEPTQKRMDRFAHLLEGFAEVPGVAMTASNNSPPFVEQRPWNRSTVKAEGQSNDQRTSKPQVNFQTVSADYFRLMRIPLLRGRAFEPRDRLDARAVCVVGETLAARLWPEQEAVGKRLLLGPLSAEENDWITVVGVVRDVRHQGLDRAAGPDLYRPASQLAWKQVHFLVSAAQGINPMSLVPSIERQVSELDPDVGVFNFTLLEDEVSNALWQLRLRAWLLGFFATVALVLTATGLYGIVGHRVEQRTHEIGIRMALGATRGSVVCWILQTSLRPVLFGLILGVASALAFSHVLRTSLFGVSNLDVGTCTAVCALLAATAVAASWLPARRGTLIDPVAALRAD
ncbi:MAG: ABC transporter permease [Verrucomicrobiota bacterium]|nr:ABC transporter permease [Verrucomicrobiota bacterium]